MPLYHTMGVRSLLSMALVDGVFACLPRFSSEGALALIERECLTCLYLVPTLFHELVSHPRFAATATDSVRKIGFAGAAMTDGLPKRVDWAFRPKLFVNHYGSSEIYTFTIDQQAARKPGSAGRAGLNQRIRVVRLGSDDPEQPVASSEEGEIIADLAGEEAFEGYWRRPEADAKAIYAGWYFTGDIGYRDADGDLFVTGRVDDMIVTGGENVSPGEIESVLSLHPAVAEVAVAGLPDPRWGQRIVGFIKRSSPVAATALDDWCRRSSLANFKRPRDFVFVKEVPRSPVGKLLRRKLVAGEFELESDDDITLIEGNRT
jgi:2-furoate---CoA ligase